jgi:REP element-mobilizing transposase RayT
MGEPPRLTAITIPSGTSLVYFVTMCVEGRRKVLASDQVFETIRAIGQLRNWRVCAGVIMPDHVHLVITPTQDRGMPAGDFATGFKRILRKEVSDQDWEWQRGCFDRLLRSHESAQQKWLYLEQNPVRAGLVSRVEDWPYYLGSLREDGNGKLTAFPTEEVGAIGNGKLTASPTVKGSPR